MTTPILIGIAILLLIEAGRILFQPSENLPGNSYAGSGRQEPPVSAQGTYSLNVTDGSNSCSARSGVPSTGRNSFRP